MTFPVKNLQDELFYQALLEATPDVQEVSQDMLQSRWDVADTEYDRLVRSRARVQQVAKKTLS